MLVGAFFAVLALLVSLTEAYEDSPKPATSSSPALAMPASSSNVAGGQSDAPSAYPDMAVCKVQTFTASPHDLIPPWGPYPIPRSQCSHFVCPFSQGPHGGHTTARIICDGATRVQGSNGIFPDSGYGASDATLYICSCSNRFTAGVEMQPAHHAGLRQRPLLGRLLRRQQQR